MDYLHNNWKKHVNQSFKKLILTKTLHLQLVDTVQYRRK